jgi:sirohydrochlorin ferrochelatase
MEMALPSISTAFQQCVAKGATHIICHPYFLSSAGRHMQEDIPRLLQECCASYPDVSCELTPCIGDYRDEMLQIITNSIENARMRSEVIDK